jgi:hypothetical protein
MRCPFTGVGEHNCADLLFALRAQQPPPNRQFGPLSGWVCVYGCDDGQTTPVPRHSFIVTLDDKNRPGVQKMCLLIHTPNWRLPATPAVATPGQSHVRHAPARRVHDARGGTVGSVDHVDDLRAGAAAPALAAHPKVGVHLRNNRVVREGPASRKPTDLSRRTHLLLLLDSGHVGGLSIFHTVATTPSHRQLWKE